MNVRSVSNRHSTSRKEWTILLLSFGKIRISLLVTFTAAAGYILATGQAGVQILLPMVGVFILACGACGLNQVQERRIDGLMERTKGRPLPSGKLRTCTALWIVFGLIASGSFVLLCGTNRMAWVLGLFAVLWYNGVYTYLKRKTAFAVLPGALIGAVPPVLGWVAGRGSIFDPRIWLIAFFFFIWQVPHFWLLLLDSAGEYEEAGLPSLTRIFRTDQIRRIVLIWILSTAVSSLLIPLFGFVNFHFLHLLLLAGTFWLISNVMMLVKPHSTEVSLRPVFMKLNLYALLVITLVSMDRLLGRYTELDLFSRMLAIIGLKHV